MMSHHTLLLLTAFFFHIQSDFTDNHRVLQLLECEFHSADYHTILDVVTGLKTAVALLEKVICLYVSALTHR